MKRLWIGVSLLAVLLFLGLGITEFMCRIHEPMAEDLKEASRLALDDEWSKAEACAKRARDLWEQNRHLTAAVADHEPMDSIDALFAELEIYAACRDSVSYSGTCAHLSELVSAMGKEHRFSWWNLL